MQVSELLPLVKANSKTYYGLDNDTKKRFQRLYYFLKNNPDRKIMSLYVGQVKKALNDESLILDYLKKFKAMKIAANGLV